MMKEKKDGRRKAKVDEVWREGRREGGKEGGL